MCESETIPGLISQSNRGSRQRFLATRSWKPNWFFRKNNSGWALHVTQNNKLVTAILPPKREVDFAYFGY
jgi:hypothetical protein